ncbi:DUF4199 domain-containing protein [Carboxylicivirga sp. N1Y90]|uniref:DUF4199 domain-containing protein n=1 Tax=Carboxylicivirga fragile TaxID=3417571 RepID=UPI003D32B595|nr:DUF4199 domain-containing protein [Marinilabiliaceae bacterium N1Y90]
MEKTVSSSKAGMTYGLYLGVISIVFTLVIYLAGMVGESFVTWISLAISIGFVSWAMINFRDKQNDGFLPYKQGVGLGFMTCFIGGVISAIFTYILFQFIDPGLVEQLVQKGLEEAIQKNPEVEGNIEMVESMTRKFMNPPVMAIMGVFSSAIFGIIISLILAAIFKKDKPMFEEETQEAAEA